MCQLYDISWEKLLLRFPLLTFQGRASFIPCAFVSIISSAQLSFHPSYFQLLKYYQYYQCFTQIANPSKLTKMSLFPTPIILCVKLHFKTGCSLFAGNMLDSCYLLTKHLVFLLPVNTFTYKRSGVHLQNGPNVFQA